MVISSESSDKENALRYAAGFVLRSLARKISIASSPLKLSMLEIIKRMKEEDDDHIATYVSILH